MPLRNLNVRRFCLKQIENFKYLGANTNFKINMHSKKNDKISAVKYSDQNFSQGTPKKELQIAYYSIVMYA